MSQTTFQPQQHAIVICGPNLRDQSRGSFHVHAAGCADLKRSKEPAYRDGWEITVASRIEASDEVYPPEEFGGESGDNLHDLHFFPCCDHVPTSA